MKIKKRIKNAINNIKESIKKLNAIIYLNNELYFYIDRQTFHLIK